MKQSSEAEPAELCPQCGSVMVKENDKFVCLKCASEIDWGMDEDEEDNQ